MTVLSTSASWQQDWRLLHCHESSHLCRLDCPFRTPSTCGLAVALRERLKEVRFLFGLLQLEERHSDSLPDLLQAIICLVPTSWQYPEICQARLALYDECYQTQDFRASFWVQAAPIHVRGEKAGLIEIVYVEEKPEAAEGPFLREERDLIDAIARHIGKTVEQFQLEQQLKVDRTALEEANIALKRVLAQIEEEKKEIYEAIHAHMEKIVMPTLRALASEIPAQQKRYVALLQGQLSELSSSFALKISKRFGHLTPAEIEICNMIRGGMSTKEIARLRHVTPATVSKQRERIRRKLDLSGSDANLTTHLLMLGEGNGNAAARGLSNEDLVF